VFTSRRRDGNLNENVSDDNKPYEDIFYSKKEGDKWTRAKNIGTNVNTLFNESNLALSPDGKTLFIYRDENAGDVYFSTREGNEETWTVPQPLPGDVNSTYRETSVSISKDGNRLYFSSDRPGGLGGSDIYVSTKNRMGEWTKVTNMGPKINTELDEDSPYIDIDGKTLYFSSEGKKGMGGFDIYKVNLINENRNEWSEAENLGFPINTPDNDIFYVGSPDKERGYYSSVRDDGMGYSDIYVVTTEPEKFASDEPIKKNAELLSLLYEVKVVDSKTQLPLEAKVSLREGGNEIESRTLKPGEYSFNIKDPDPKTYNLTVEMDGYIFQNLNLDIDGATDEVRMVSKKIEMKKLVVGATSILRNIYFDYGTAKFREESYDELNKLENMMRTNTKLIVEIAGHTDNVSSASFNMKLSQQRADAVRDFLISKGIDKQRVKAVGYGEERPLASNDDEIEGREFNRRVEFEVINN
jgi:outer membrane protein OmpA-like peptidoglycan-associated protein